MSDVLPKAVFSDHVESIVGLMCRQRHREPSVVAITAAAEFLSDALSAIPHRNGQPLQTIRNFR
jgi:hypothetical protein